ncbi:MAG: RHS repeat-associated core domain-containing protein, partial [Peptococcaceae bacterium]|nr:RHS repeat-associated core domain-containing protein [Peptococcaceae bacterium]
HMDHMGSSEFLTSDVTQRITSWTSYDEWGNITHNAVLKCGERELDLVKTYTGHERDSVLGMYYAKARMYDTADKHGSTKANKLGDIRFTAVDPVKGDARNPQTMVQYTYVLNNPLMYVDPLGEMAYTKQFDDFCEGLLESVGNEANELKDSLSSILDTDIRDIGSGLATLGKALWNGEIDLVEVAKDAGTGVAVEATYLATHADVFMPFSDKYTDQEIREAGVRVGAVLLAVSPSKKAKSITNTVENAAHLAKKVENDGTQKILKNVKLMQMYLFRKYLLYQIKVEMFGQMVHLIQWTNHLYIILRHTVHK